MNCIICNIELEEDNNCELDNGVRYSFEGQGPYCDRCCDEVERRDFIETYEDYEE